MHLGNEQRRARVVEPLLPTQNTIRAPFLLNQAAGRPSSVLFVLRMHTSCPHTHRPRACKHRAPRAAHKSYPPPAPASESAPGPIFIFPGSPSPSRTEDSARDSAAPRARAGGLPDTPWPCVHSASGAGCVLIVFSRTHARMDDRPRPRKASSIGRAERRVCGRHR